MLILLLFMNERRLRILMGIAIYFRILIGLRSIFLNIKLRAFIVLRIICFDNLIVLFAFEIWLSLLGLIFCYGFIIFGFIDIFMNMFIFFLKIILFDDFLHYE